MNWKFWDKSADKSDYVDSGLVPMSTLFRWALFDLGVTSPNTYAKTAGFSPISEEGIEVEERDSLARVIHLDAYKDFITAMASINAEIGTGAHFKALADSGVLPEDADLEEVKDKINELYYSLSASAIIASLSAALSLGIIVNPGAYVLEGGPSEQF